MRQPTATAPREGASHHTNKGLSPPALAALVLALLAAGIAAWLQLSGPPIDEGAGPAVVLKLTPPPASLPATPRIQPDTPPAAAPTPPEAPQSTAAAVTPPMADTTPPASSAPVRPDTPAPPPAPEATTTPAPQKPPSAETPMAPAAVVEGLRPAPDPDLVEVTRLGHLPRVSRDGRKAWQTYARPFDAGERRPRISIIISGLGLSGAATEAAIQRLPGPITLAFAPYAKGLPQWIALARAAGHEVLLDLPMEPVNFPTGDLGPHTLLTSLTAKQNQVRLHWLLGQVTGYVGVVNRMGSRFTTSELHVGPVLKELEQRGLLFVDSRSSLRSIAGRMAKEVGLPRAINNRFIDAEASRAAIDNRLAEIERIAKTAGRAVGIGSPFPVTIDRLVHWAQTLEGKGLTLAPVSATVSSQQD